MATRCCWPPESWFGIVVEPLAEAHRSSASMARLCRSAVFSLLAAVVEQRQLDVLERRRARQQVEALEDEADLRVAEIASSSFDMPRDVLAVEEVVPARRPIEAAEDVHERRLAGARRARHRHELAGLDVELRRGARALSTSPT